MVDIMHKNKTKITLKEKFIVALAGLIASSVFLLAIHAKDVVRYGDIDTASRVTYKDISNKSLGELHNHIDKQMVKSFDKGTSDNAVVASRSRGDIDLLPGEEDPGILVRLQETLLLWHVYASLPFTVA